MTEITAAAHKVLESWFSQKPTCALMGEFSAGKSTLLNLLLGTDVLPTQVTATNMPVTWLTYAEEPKCFALGHDGVLTEFDFATLGQQGAAGHLLIRLEVPSEILRRIDIIDTPGISDPRLAQGALNFLGPYLDFAIWCSAANQAWRQTEKAMWKGLPSIIRSNSILALTRADTLRKASDLKKVLSRCQKETDRLFHCIIPLATLAALQARAPDGTIIDADAWKKSYAAAFFSTLEESIDVAVKNCDMRETLETVAITTAPAEPKKSPKAAAKKAASASAGKESGARATTPPAKKPKVEKEKDGKTSLAISGLVAEIRQLVNAAATIVEVDQTFIEVDHILNTFKLDTNISNAHQMVLRQVMSLDRTGNLPKKKVLAQLERELEDFTEGPWYNLDEIH